MRSSNTIFPKYWYIWLFVLCSPLAVAAQCHHIAPDTEDIALREALAHRAFFEPHHLNNVGNNYDLNYHRLDLTLDPAVNYIKGSITSYFRMTQTGSSLTFDLINALTIDSVVYHGGLLPYSRNLGDILEVLLPAPLATNTSDSVQIYYQGAPQSTGFGSFQQQTHNGVPIIWTLSEPYGAKEWWPCKQDLNDKIDSIDTYVTTPEGYRAAGNGLLASEQTLAGGLRRYHWRHRYPIAAYLVATAVTNYAVYSNWVPMPSGAPLEVLNYVYPEDSATIAGQTPDIIPTLQLYNRLFEPYPFRKEKYGHAQFGWGGGMEHQTMSFMVGFSRYLMAHELAHQWFGDKITCASWRDIWLNEGFASYCEGLTTENREPNNWKSWKKQRVDRITAQPGGTVYVDDTASVWRVFDGRLTYDKGSYILHMLRFTVGDTLFFHTIRNYLAAPNLAYKYASTGQFQAILEQTTGRNFDEFFADWVYHEGYPTFTVSYTQNGSALTLNVSQMPSISNRFYETGIPIQYVGTQGEILNKTYQNTINGQIFTENIPFQVAQVLFDPEYWLIAKCNLPRVSGVELIDNHIDLAIFPNPARDFVMVHLNTDLLFR